MYSSVPRTTRHLKVGKGTKANPQSNDADITFSATLEAPTGTTLSEIENGVALLVPEIEREISTTIKFDQAFTILKDTLMNGGFTSSLIGDVNVNAKNVNCKSGKSSKVGKAGKSSKAGKDCKLVTTELDGLGKINVLVSPLETGCTAPSGRACYKFTAYITVLFSFADVTSVVTDVIAGPIIDNLIVTALLNAGILVSNLVITDITTFV